MNKDSKTTQNGLTQSILSLAIAACLSQGVSAQQQSTYTYYPDGTLASMDGPRLDTDVIDVTTYTYHTGTRNRATIVNALNQTIQLDNYNGRGQAQLIIDENNVHTQLTYHPRGWLESITVVDPSGDANLNSVTQYEYYDNGDVERVTLPNGATLTYDYDDANRLREIRNNDGEYITYTLDNAGNRTQETVHDASNTLVYTATRAYDELSRVMDIIGAEGQTTHIDYDTNSNPITLTNPKQLSTDQDHYDQFNRLRQVIDANAGSTQFAYDDLDRLTSVTDANGNTTTYTYDIFDNVIQIESPDTGISTYQYDDANNRTQMIDARGIITDYTYDALNRLATISYPADPSENVTYHYDNYTMDSSNPDADEAHSYAVGRLTGIDGEFTRTRFYYDHRGNITKQKDTLSTNYKTQTYITRYRYTLDNQISTMTYPSGLVVAYGYDTQGRVDAIDVTYQDINNQAQQLSLIDAITYQPFGGIKDIAFGNGINISRTYDNDYRLDTVDVSDASTSFVNLDYGFDLNSNITTITDNNDITLGFSYGYDNLDRLITDDSDSLETQQLIGHFSHQYDAVGNRTETTATDYHAAYGPHQQDWGFSYDTNSNRLTSTRFFSGGLSTEYDAAGNLTQRVRYESTPSKRYEYTDTFGYNHAGRLSSSSTIKYLEREESDRTYPAVELHYAYNPLGQRVYKQNGPNAAVQRHNHFAYNLQGQVIYDEYAVTINSTVSGLPYLREWIYLNGQPIAQVTQAQQNAPQIAYDNPFVTSYYLDHLGTPKMGFDQSGNKVWSAVQSAFGEEFVTTVHGTSQLPWNPIRMPGQYQDDETGLFYNWHRYYDPVTGRYLKTDPLGLFDGPNPYLYGQANPLSYYDPNGLTAASLTWCFGGPAACAAGIVTAAATALYINAVSTGGASNSRSINDPTATGLLSSSSSSGVQYWSPAAGTGTASPQCPPNDPLCIDDSPRQCTFGSNTPKKIRKHINQVRNRHGVKQNISSPGQGGINQVQQIIQNRVAQGGASRGTYAGQPAYFYQDGKVVYVLRPSGQFWTILRNTR